MIPRNLSRLRSRVARRTLLTVAALGVCGAAAAGSTSLASAAGSGVTSRSAVSTAAGRPALAVKTDAAQIDAAQTVAAQTVAAQTDDTAPADDVPTCIVGTAPLDVEAINAEQHALADYLTGKGIAFTVEAHDGIDWVVPTGTDEATLTALDDFMWAQHPMPADVIAQINADTAEMVDYLAGKGITVEVTTDRHGISTPQFDPADPAVAAALDQYFQDKGVDGGVVFAADATTLAVPAAADGTEMQALPAIGLPAIAVPADGTVVQMVGSDSGSITISNGALTPLDPATLPADAADATCGVMTVVDGAAGVSVGVSVVVSGSASVPGSAPAATPAATPAAESK